jgi:hypothetical protein
VSDKNVTYELLPSSITASHSFKKVRSGGASSGIFSFRGWRDISKNQVEMKYPYALFIEQ